MNATIGLHPALDRDRFLLRQKLITLSEKYVVCDDEQRPILYVERPAHFWRNLGAIFATIFASRFIHHGRRGAGHDGLAGNWAALDRARAGGSPDRRRHSSSALFVGIRLSPKRHISFFTDESKEKLLLQVLQDKKFQPIVATYTVITPEGDLSGTDEQELSLQFLPKKMGRLRR